MGNIFLEIDVDIAYTLLTDRVQSLAVDLLEGKQILFERFCELRLNLRCSGSRIYCSDKALLNLEGRELIFVHPTDSKNSDTDDGKDKERHDSFL